MQFLPFAALATLLLCQAAESQEVVTNEPLAQDQLIATLPVLALRELDIDKVIITAKINSNNTWMISGPAAVGSVLSSEQIPQQVKGEIERTAYRPIDEWKPSQKKAMASAVDTWVGQLRFGRPSGGSDHTSDIETKSRLISILPRAKDAKADKLTPIDFGNGSQGVVNFNVVERILAVNKIIQTSGSMGSKSNASERSAILDLNTEFAEAIQDTYYPLKTIPFLKTDVERLSAVNNAIQEAAYQPPVAEALLINQGEVDFGIPLAFTAKEKSLQVEPSLLRRFDIYWIQLAVSPHEELLHNVTELRYDIAMSDSGTIALDLVPTRYGIEVTAADKAGTPAITVGDVEVGEMFSRTIQYKYIRPTILSHGLQTPSFGWTFTGESLDASAKRMFVVIGVPRGSKQVNSKISLEAKCSSSFGLAYQWASTGPTEYRIPLPQ